MLALVPVAVSLGLSNFAASIAIGMSGVDQRLRLRVAVTFGLFEAGMPIIGLLVGHQASHALGSHAHIVGGVLLIATGAFTVVQASRAPEKPPAGFDLRSGPLVLMAAGLSMDNLVVGFALGTDHAPLAVAVAVIAIVSVGLSLLGLELGDRLGDRIEHNSELIAGIVLICVGAAVMVDVL